MVRLVGDSFLGVFPKPTAESAEDTAQGPQAQRDRDVVQVYGLQPAACRAASVRWLEMGEVGP